MEKGTNNRKKKRLKTEIKQNKNGKFPGTGSPS